jgi:hypothetical protein
MEEPDWHQQSPDRCAEILLADPASPAKAEAFVRSLLAENSSLFVAQEDTLFDYKRDYPHSLTDDYFAAICRLVFAFHNSFGGVIIIGVHDEKRTGGHNKIIVNIERLNTRLRELSGHSINAKHQKIEINGTAVDLLIVPKRHGNISPVSLAQNLDKYTAGTVWLRRGHEVLEAEGRDIPFLFGPRNYGSIDEKARILSYLPPPPSTINRFVGRIDLLGMLLDWLTTEDEPRLFLWGRGGSGKSTVAYEFASLIRDYGRSIKLPVGSFIDRVIFLTAKEKELNTSSGKMQRTSLVDFSDLDSLLKGVLIAADYSAQEDYNQISRAGLEQRVKELFDHENILLIIDDIDTLTTKGIDGGFDVMYKMSIRASGFVKLLYTQRNLPVSAESELQVPGFVRDEDYVEFVGHCCDQFGVPMPDAAYLNGGLKEISECIPLIIETLIRLRRTCGSYEKAHNIFLERRGDEARRYLFEREYEVLPADNNARHVLAAIAEFGQPVGNDEIGAVVRIGESAISESIGQVLGFFLSTEVSSEGETKYFLNPVTRVFVREKSKTLNFGEQISERVKAFKSAGQKKPKDVVIVEGEVDRLLARGELSEALVVVMREYPPRVTENPSFRMLRARVLAQQSLPRIAEAREDFKYCVDQSYENADGMRVWLTMERKHGQSYKAQIEVCNYEINGKSYAEAVKHEFVSRRSVVQYFMARDSGFGDTFNLMRDALVGHVQAYNFFWRNGGDTNLHYKNVRNTTFALLREAQQQGLDKEVVRILRDLNAAYGSLCDPLFDPFKDLIMFLSRQKGGDVGRRRSGLLRGLLSDLERGSIHFERPETTRRAVEFGKLKMPQSG